MREKVGFGGRWVKAVRWRDGDGFNPHSIQLTTRQEEAITFLPEAAAAIRAKFSPEAIAKAAALRRELDAEMTRFLAKRFVDQMKKSDPKSVPAILEIIKWL